MFKDVELVFKGVEHIFKGVELVFKGVEHKNMCLPWFFAVEGYEKNNAGPVSQPSLQ